MGDIAEMIVEGVLCQECGGAMEDEQAPGHPRSCSDCERSARRDGKKKRRARNRA